MDPALPFAITTVLFGLSTIALAARRYRDALRARRDRRPLRLPKLLRDASPGLRRGKK